MAPSRMPDQGAAGRATQWRAHAPWGDRSDL